MSSNPAQPDRPGAPVEHSTDRSSGPDGGPVAPTSTASSSAGSPSAPGTSGGVVSRRPRGRLARLTGRHVTAYSPILEPLIRTLKVRHPREDLDLIIRAYEVAEACHAGQRRKSGDPYITHPVAVATILAELCLLYTSPSPRD